MPPVGIVGLGAYVPPKVMTNEDWAELIDTSDEWITTKTGMKERRIAADDVCTSDLAVNACRQALEEAGIGPEDVDLLILATSSPDVPLSSETVCGLGRLMDHVRQVLTGLHILVVHHTEVPVDEVSHRSKRLVYFGDLENHALLMAFNRLEREINLAFVLDLLASGPNVLHSTP